ncbi:MAG: tRNA (adenosine(37)-N6)-threonylcarbamoyltransferase complex dimerization subunit type 1 TsaB [Gammaproteobacteria bacterium]|jgi:tRNA threonylcarbamoyladenosine biosynthesis protein TsaB|nr:tRNA (adenosine(37)-N6)-threonylcarbamoyltransferase complex dimerization subunit type 1 TsaB [Gammaproteobacteria bacterium]|tara:strand:- start:864 stop:1541 length:678 start_codon:yes stop_codon:yes gene_type:complete
MNLLAIDTTSKTSAVGLQVGEKRWQSVTAPEKFHSRDILPTIVELVDSAGISLGDLDTIVFGKGPGSFTGMRITVGVVQGLAFGLGIPVIPVSSLACLAQGEYRESGATNTLVVLSARKEEVYYGAYQIHNACPDLVGEEGVLHASLIPRLENCEWVGVGDGWGLRKKLELATGQNMKQVRLEACPQPEDLLDIGAVKLARGETTDAMKALPEYLRENVAKKSNS